MPAGNLSAAVVSPSSTVLPFGLCASLVEVNLYPVLSGTPYHDGTAERSLITDGVNPARSLRAWKWTRRVTEAQLVALRTFWMTTVQGPLKAFYFYNPYDVLPGHAIGSNWDATGVSTQGRVTVRFQGPNWSETIDLGRANVSELTVAEVA